MKPAATQSATVWVSARTSGAMTLRFLALMCWIVAGASGELNGIGI
jgi:hypothetical protein